MHGATGCGGYQLGALKMLVVRSCRVARGVLGRPWRRESGRRGDVPEFLAVFGGPGGQGAAQKSGRNGATMRTKRYADCGLEDMRAKSSENITYFEHSEKSRKLVPEEGAKYITRNDVP